MSNVEYFMIHPEENWRLANKVDPDVLVDKYLQKYLKDDIIVLDLGCGPGVITKRVAEKNPSLHITGLDMNRQALQKANKIIKNMHNIDFRYGSIYALPFKENSVNFVYCRFLFEYLARPLDAIAEMKRVCTTGGHILIQDLDGQFLWNFPEEPFLQDTLQKISLRLKKHTGFDPNTGRKLHHYLYKAGLKNLEVRAEHYHLYAGAIDEKNYKLWEKKLNIAFSNLQQELKGIDTHKFKKEFLSYLKREDTLSYSVIFTVSGLKE